LSVDWRLAARRAGVSLSANDTTIIELEGGARQTVEFLEDDLGEALRVRSLIATRRVASEAAGLDPAWRYAWERNRLSDLVGFTLDSRKRLVGEVWIPLAGVTPEEFKLYVRELARVCDWHEFRLTGQDVY
jgi:hypothetical protein